MADNPNLFPVLGIISVVVFVVCTVLYFLTYSAGKRTPFDVDKRESAAIIIGIVMTLVWTVALWPTMTGGGTGAYVVYVNGVATEGGFVNFMYGFVTIFIGGIVFLGLPRVLGYGINKLRESGKSNAEGKRSTPALVVSIVGTFVGWVLIQTGISLISSPKYDVELPGAISIIVIGLIPFALGIRGILRFARAK